MALFNVKQQVQPGVRRRSVMLGLFAVVLVSVTLYSGAREKYSAEPLTQEKNTAAQDNIRPQLIAFTNANILDPSVELPINNATILVMDGKIQKIQPDTVAIPNEASVQDLKGQWVIPGLIDGHIHLAQSGGAFTRPDIIDATMLTSYESEQAWLLDHQEAMLAQYTAMGITSVFDLGGPVNYLGRYKAFAQQPHLPEIYFAGSLLAPMAVAKLDANGPTFSHTTSPGQAMAVVKQQIAQGTHILKLVWIHDTGLSSEDLTELYSPAISLAKSHGLVVAVHVEGLDSAKTAVKAGADILVHGVMREAIDQELIALMQQHSVTYMPTLIAFEHYFAFFKGELTFNQLEKDTGPKAILGSFEVLDNNLANVDQMLQIFRKYMPMVDDSQAQIAALSQQEQGILMQLKSLFSSQYLQLQKQNLQQVVDAGVNVAIGTDAGNMGTLHGPALVSEMLAWKMAGVSHKAILKAATQGAALAYHLEATIGSLATGKTANFVVLADNPFDHLMTLSKPVLVVNRGVIVSGGGLDGQER